MEGYNLNKKRIAFITPGVLPFPPQKGGAVETLLFSFLSNYNQSFCSTVFSIGHKRENFQINDSFSVESIRKPCLISRLFFHFLNRFFNGYLGNSYIRKVYKVLRKSDFDLIVVENAPEYGIFLKKKHANQRIVLHIHNDYINEDYKYLEKLDNVYSSIFAVNCGIKLKVIVSFYTINLFCFFHI